MIESRSVSPVETREIFEPLTEYLREEGAEPEFVERNGTVSLKASVGSGEPHVCLSGHFDVVPAEPSSWKVTQPFEPLERDGRLYGRGAADMKGGLAAQAVALSNLKELENGKVTLAVSGDEEVSPSDGTPSLLDSMEKVDYAVIAEPTGMDVKRGFRGIVQLEITVKGASGHASRPQLAESPMERAADLIGRIQRKDFDREFEGFPTTTCEVTRLRAGDALNVIPSRVEVGVDIRFNPAYTQEEILQEIREMLDGNTELKVVSTTDSAYTEDEELVENVVSQVEAAGYSPKVTCEGGASDGKFFHSREVPFVQLGPKKTSHMSDEHVPVQQLKDLEPIYTRLCRSLTAR